MLALAACLLAVTAQAAELVRIEGVDRTQSRNIQAWIGEPVTAEEAVLRGFMRSAGLKARKAMQTLGYYDAVLEFTLEQSSTNGLYILLRVQPGEPVRVHRITFSVTGEAGDDGTARDLDTRWQLAEGDLFHHGKWNESKRGVRELLRRRGYFDHRILVSEARLDLTEHRAELDLRIDSGRRYRFGETRFEGASLATDLLAGYLPWRSGDAYDQDQVRRLERLLQDTRFFAKIELETEPSTGTGTVDMVIRVEQRKPNAVSIGPGMTTDTGPRLRLGWDKPWLGPSGHSLRTTLDWSGPRNEFDAVYAVPIDPPISRALEFNLNWQDEDFDDHASERLRAAIQHRRRHDPGWDHSWFLRLQEERFRTAGDQGRSLLLLPGTSWSRTRRHGGALASRGDRVYAEAQLASEHLVSDVSLLRFGAGARWLRTLIADIRLHLRVDAGTLISDRFDEVPTSLRFFAGGDRSIRGFAYQSLGPEDSSGEVVGGRSLLVASAEFDWPIAPDWRAAFFVDGGSAFDDAEDPVQVGIGGGVRWLSPVGPVRVDLAVGIDRSETGLRLHFSLGPDL